VHKLPLVLIPALVVAGCGPRPAPPPWTGEQRALVVLASWSDTEPSVTRDEVEAAFFGEDGLTAWFAENSAGAFTWSGEVLDWRELDEPWDDREPCEDQPLAELLWDAAAGDVARRDHDADGNRRIDHLFLLHDARSRHHRISWRCMFAELKVADHTMVMEAQGLGPLGASPPIGLYVHEAGHAHFGFEDLYGARYRGRYGIGMWGLMGLGQWGPHHHIEREQLWRHPTHLEPFHKVRVGWVEPQLVEDTTRGVRLRPVESSGDVVQIARPGGVTYTLEVRSPVGFSAGLPGHGLLVWREGPDGVDLIQADGRDDLNHGTDLGANPLPPIDENFGDAADPFPGAEGVTSYVSEADGVRLEGIELQADGSVILDVVLTS